MSNFIWPSDLDRAENDELNRVCEQLEAVMDERDAALEREVALQAYADEGRRIANDWIEHEQTTTATWQLARQIGKWALGAPIASLTQRDLLQRAEELDALAEHFLVGESHKHFIKQRAYRLRQQAKELAKCHSPKT